MTRLTLLLMTALGGGSIAIACAPSSGDDAEQGESSIVGGTQALRHEHATLVDINRGAVGGACSGSVIAPRVVLTAGHCIVGALGFTVTTPYSGRQRARGRGVVYDYTETANRVNPNQHDVGLIILESPIRLAKYPRLNRAPLPANTPVTKIGRIQDGVLSNVALYESRAMTVSDGRSYGYPYSFVSSEVIQSGDSGGPDVIATSDPPIIVAVNSGAGGGTEVLARVDLLAQWIDTQVNAAGGYDKPDAGADGGADAGADAAKEAGTDAGVDAAKEAGAGDGGGNGDGGGKTDASTTSDSGSGKKDDPVEEPTGADSQPDQSDEPSSGAEAPASEDEEQASPRKKSAPSSSGCSQSSSPSALRGGGVLLFAIALGAVAAARRRRR